MSTPFKKTIRSLVPVSKRMVMLFLFPARTAGKSAGAAGVGAALGANAMGCAGSNPRAADRRRTHLMCPSRVGNIPPRGARKFAGANAMECAGANPRAADRREGALDAPKPLWEYPTARRAKIRGRKCGWNPGGQIPLPPTGGRTHLMRPSRFANIPPRAARKFAGANVVGIPGDKSPRRRQAEDTLYAPR